MELSGVCRFELIVMFLGVFWTLRLDKFSLLFSVLLIVFKSITCGSLLLFGSVITLDSLNLRLCETFELMGVLEQSSTMFLDLFN